MPLKGTATGTLPAAKGDIFSLPEGKVALQAAAIAKGLMGMLPRGEVNAAPTAEQVFAPILRDIQSRQAPTPMELPSVPSGANAALGLIATNLGSIALRRPELSAFPMMLQRLGQREEVQAANMQQQNAFEREKYLDFLNTRKDILTAQYQKALADENFDKAQKAQEQLFPLTQAMEAFANAQAQNTQRDVARIGGQYGVEMQRVAGLLDLFKMNGGGGDGGDPAASAKELAEMLSAQREIDLKIPSEGEGAFSWAFGKKVGDEELRAFLRDTGAHITSANPGIPQTAITSIRGAMTAKFGNDLNAKLQFLTNAGFRKLNPGQARTAATPYALSLAEWNDLVGGDARPKNPIKAAAAKVPKG